MREEKGNEDREDGSKTAVPWQLSGRFGLYC